MRAGVGIAAALIVLLWAMPARAQTVGLTCGVTQPTTPVSIVLGATPRMLWCLERVTRAFGAVSQHWLFVNDMRYALDGVCEIDPGNYGLECKAPIPAGILATMRKGGTFRLAISRTPGAAENALLTESPQSATYTIMVTAPPVVVIPPVVIPPVQPGVCVDINLTVTPPVKLTTRAVTGTSLGVRTSYSSQNHALSVALLRAAGWRVEQQRVQWAAPVPATGMTNGYWFVTAVCVGAPQ